MPELLLEHGLLSLFLLSFCASTLLPLGSEWLLVSLLLEGINPLQAVSVATFGNSLGAATNYLLGWLGSDWLIQRLLRIGSSQRQRAQNWFNRFGSWALLFSWLPIVGDPLCLVSGSLKTPLLKFVMLVTSGKALRYASVAFITLQCAKTVA